MKKQGIITIAISVFIIIAFTANTIFAEEDPTNSTNSNKSDSEIYTAEIDKSEETELNNRILELSLEDALSRIETGNSLLKLTDSKIAIYKKQYEQALARHNAKYAEVDEESARHNRLNYKRALWTLENAEHDREIQLKELNVQIINQYQEILALQNQVKNLELQLKNVDIMTEQLNLQIGLGLAIESQLYAIKVQRNSLETALNATQNNINSLLISLKRDLGIDIKQDVMLTSELIPYQKFDDSKINELINNAIKEDYDIKRYEQDIELTEIEYKIADFYGNESANQLQISLEDKKATLEDLAVNKRVNLQTQYNNIKQLENNIETARLQVEADRISRDILEKKIAAGTASSVELIQLNNQLINDEQTLQQYINSYMAAVSNFKISLGI